MIQEHVAATGSAKGREILDGLLGPRRGSSRRSCPTTTTGCSRAIAQYGGEGPEPSSRREIEAFYANDKRGER